MLGDSVASDDVAVLALRRNSDSPADDGR
jgi:hypothetical protein